MRTQLVDSLLPDLLQDVRFLLVALSYTCLSRDWSCISASCLIEGPAACTKAQIADCTIGSPKMRVEIFTLARGARACIESTQFIIMTIRVIIIN